MTPYKLLAALALSLAACNTTEIFELRRVARSCLDKLVRDRVVADNLNQYRRDRDLLERRLQSLVGGTVQELGGKGTAADALASIRARSDLAGPLDSFKIDERGNWKASFVALARLPPAPAHQSAPATPPLPRALPNPSILSGSQGKRLREEIARCERETADLGLIVAEVRNTEKEIKSLEETLKVLDALKSANLGSAPGSLESFFGGARPLLRSGQLEFKRTSGLRVSGKLAPGRTQDELRSAVPESLALIRLEESAGTVSLDAEARHPGY
ncbi:MAG: hypothetical protein QM765_43410 [Myxococcales bacterium]